MIMLGLGENEFAHFPGHRMLSYELFVVRTSSNTLKIQLSQKVIEHNIIIFNDF